MSFLHLPPQLVDANAIAAAKSPAEAPVLGVLDQRSTEDVPDKGSSLDKVKLRLSGLINLLGVDEVEESVEKKGTPSKAMTIPAAQQPQSSVVNNHITVKSLQSVLPANLKNVATESLVDKLNNIAYDPEIAADIRSNYMSYTRILTEGRFSIEEYLSAVTYVSFRLRGSSAKDAYIKTFPDRYAIHQIKQTSESAFAAYVSAYNKGKLVNLIMEQSLVPSWVLNQDLYQEAINHQAYLMSSAKSEIVQQKAAEALMVHLAKPKEAGPLISINTNESSGMNELKNTLGLLAKQQLELINSGVTTKQIASQGLVIDVEDV